MAIPFLTAIDLSKNELQNAVIQNLASDPSGPVEGLIYYNTVDKTLREYSNAAWRDIPWLGSTSPTAEGVGSTASVGTAIEAARADHRHAMPALATTSVDGFFSATDKTTLTNATASNTASTLVLRDGSARFQAADPSAAQDVATKAYVDATAQGLDTKASVRVATDAALPAYTRTANVITATSFGALAAVDGVTLVLNDRLLLKDGAAGADNGLWYVSQVGTGGTPYTLTRTTDADSSAKVTAGLYAFSTEGTNNADIGWVLTTDDPITLNTTSLAFSQFSSSATIIAGNGLTKTGNTLDVGAGTGILSNANDVAIDTSIVVQKFSASIGDNSSTQIDVVHNFGTRDVVIAVARASSPWETVVCDVERLDTNTARFRFSIAPTTNQFRVTIHA